MAQKWQNCIELLFHIAWQSLKWKYLKDFVRVPEEITWIYQLESEVHAFQYPICWKKLTNGWNGKVCMKIAWKFSIDAWKSVSVWKYCNELLRLSTWFMTPNTLKFVLKCLTNYRKVACKLCEALHWCGRVSLLKFSVMSSLFLHQTWWNWPLISLSGQWHCEYTT